MDTFWPKVKPADWDACWDWTAYCSKGGYGIYTLPNHPAHSGRKVQAHRFAWESLRGPIPDGLKLDHLCRNRKCVNPEHLEPVTQRVNVLRGVGTAAINARKTHCPAGHEYTPENTYRYQTGKRSCKTCIRNRSKVR